MNRFPNLLAYVFSAVCGVVLWVSIANASGLPEAWDSRLYYVYGIPAMVIISFGLGYFWFHRPWRWPLTIMASQAVAAIIQNPLANLLPLGLVAFAILGIPSLIAAYLGAFVRRRTRAH